MLPKLLKTYRVSWQVEGDKYGNVEIESGECSEEAVLKAMNHIADRFTTSGTPKTVIITKVTEVKR